MLNFIFPKKDIKNNIWKYFSNKIKKELISHDEVCYICKKKSKDFKTHTYCKKQYSLDKIITCFYYTDKIKKYILQFKFYHKKHIQEEIWELMNMFFDLYITNDKSKTAITHVPMHWWRKYFIKWYNQSEILAHYIWKKQNIKVINLCKKNKLTKPQSKIKKRANRVKNIKNTFSCKKLEWIENIIIVDDILTSWTTLEELSKTIKQQNKNINISAIVFARK